MSFRVHEDYCKELLREIAGDRFVDKGDEVIVNYGTVTANIDGVIGDCAIEIESRVNKQVRGALLDLLEHPYSKKLLILVPAHMPNPEASVKHCEYILNKYKEENQIIKVVLLKGTGHDPKKEEDKELIRKALIDLGVL